NLGNAYYYLGNFTNAVNNYENTLKAGSQSDSELATIHYNLANALTGIEAKNYNSASIEERRIEEYKQAINLNPTFIEAYNNLGLIYSSKQDGQNTAIQYLKEALRGSAAKSPPEDSGKTAILHFNLANLMYQKISGEIRQGCKSSSSRENDNRYRPHPATERLLEEIQACVDDRECKKVAVGKWQEALIRQPLLRDSDESSLFQALPLNVEKKRQETEECLRENFDKFADVINHYEKAIQINRNFLEAYNNLGIVYLESSRFEQAIEYFRKALSIERQAIFVHNNLGVAFFKSDRTEEGEAEYKRVKELRDEFLNNGERPESQNIEMNAELRRGRIAPWSLARSQTLHTSSMYHFTPEGYDQAIPVMNLWNTNVVFEQIDIPIAPPNQIREKLKYQVLPSEKFQQHTNLTSPVVRILGIFYKHNKQQVGAGFLVKKEDQVGYIVTAYHNISDEDKEERIEWEADKIVVQFLTPIPEARQARIVLRGSDDTGVKDLALLRVEDVPAQIPVVELADSLPPKPDEPAIVVGHPCPYSDPNPNDDRCLKKRWQLSNIRFKAVETNQQYSFQGQEIKSGNSGGPVYASQSVKVIGMMTSISPSNDDSEAIPVGAIANILSQLQKQ
ncbi:MAG: tetratricopeptide repeat protein, partial [Xenococcus sp. (in: cyanobacteria)]